MWGFLMPWRQYSHGTDRRKIDRADEVQRRREAETRDAEHEARVADMRRFLDEQHERLRNRGRDS